MPHREDSTPGGPHAAGSATDAFSAAELDNPRRGVQQETVLGGQNSAAPPASEAGLDAQLSLAAPRVARLEPDGEAAAPEPGSAAAYEAEERRQEAFDIAWRYLSHRDRTEAEMRRNFTKKRVDPALAEEVVAALLRAATWTTPSAPPLR